MLRAVLEDYEKGWSNTQGLRDYPLVRYFYGGKPKSIGSHTHTTTLRLRPKTTGGNVRLYESVGGRKEFLTGRFSSRPSFYEDKVFYEKRELELKSDETELFDYIKSEFDGHKEKFHEDMERQLVAAPLNINDDLTPWSLDSWLPTVPAGTEDYAGGFNGTTTYFGDGTTTVNLGVGATTVDRSDANNLRARSYAANYDGNWNAQTKSTLRRAFTRTRFRTIAGTRGNSNDRRELTIFLPDDFADQYEEALDRGTTVDQARRDLMPDADGMIFSRPYVRVPVLADDALKSIYAVNPNELYTYLVGGKWDVRGDPASDPNKPNILIVPFDSGYGMHCRNPRIAGFRLSLPRV